MKNPLKREQKPDFNKMSEEELEKYVSNLPEKPPSPWKSIAALGLFSIMSIIAPIFAIISNGFKTFYLLLIIAGALGIVGTVYLIYKAMKS